MRSGSVRRCKTGWPPVTPRMLFTISVAMASSKSVAVVTNTVTRPRISLYEFSAAWRIGRNTPKRPCRESTFKKSRNNGDARPASVPLEDAYLLFVRYHSRGQDRLEPRVAVQHVGDQRAQLGEHRLGLARPLRRAQQRAR